MGTRSRKGKTRKPLAWKTERLLTVSGLGLGTSLALVGTLDIFPIYVNLVVYAASLISILFGFWKWEWIAHWGKLQKTVTLFIVSLASAWVLSYPVREQYEREIMTNLEFKESSELSFWRQQIIRYDLGGFRAYLTSLGIAVPSDLPPFSISGQGIVGTHTPPEMPIYRGDLTIGKQQLGDRTAPTMVYGSFVIEKLFEHSQIARGGPSWFHHFLFGTQIEMATNLYFNWSYWGKRSPAIPNPETGILWEVRQQLGQEYTDKLIASLLLVTADTPDEGIATVGENFSVEFKRKLAIADSLVESDKANWPVIQKLAEPLQ